MRDEDRQDGPVMGKAAEASAGASLVLPLGLAQTALNAMDLGVYCIDHDGACTFVNEAALAALGYGSAEEILGRNMHNVIHHTRIDGIPCLQAECPLQHIIKDGRSTHLADEILWRKNGTFFVADYSLTPMRDGGKIIGSVVTFRNHADRTDIEARLAVQHAVGRVLAGEDDLDDALPRILQAIGTGFGWNMGVFWIIDANDQALVPVATWHASGVQAPALERQTTELRFQRNEGMLGRVWTAGAPELVSDLRQDTSIPRQVAAAADGFGSAIGIPVKAGARTLAILEFLDGDLIRLDKDLRNALATLGQQIGQFIRRRRAEQALREREEHYRFMADSIPQLVWTATSTGALDYVNARWIEYCGLSSEDALGLGWESVIHPDDLTVMGQTWQSSLRTGLPYTIEARIRRHDGVYRWYLNRAVPLLDADGRALRWFGSSTDVEEAKRAERDIRISEERFRSLVEATSAIVWTAPVSGAFTGEQLSWATFTGQDSREYQGSGWLDAVHPDDRSHTAAAWEGALRQARMYEVEHRLRRHDGQWRHMTARAVPILAASDGAIREWVGLHTDVTETRRTERALRESQERLRAALLASRTGTFRWDIGGNLFEMDESFCRLVGLPPAHSPVTLQDALLAFVHPEDRDAILAEVERIVAEDCEVEIEYRVIRPADGVMRWISGKGKTTRGSDGRPLHMIGAIVDVTERRCFEEELVSAKEAAEEANRAKSQFIANMSHELRTPLSAVIGYTELLEEEVGDLDAEGTGNLLDDISKIRSNARHLLDLISDVLDLSKVEAGKMEVQVEDFCADALLSDVTETVQALMSRNDNELILDLAPSGLGTMYSDPVKLRQCLFNLLSNAAKFTEKGRITLCARRLPGEGGGGERLEFRIRDTGIGMTEAQLRKLFQRFSQADSSTTRRFGGTGLGLALTKALCHLMGGDISAESALGEGSAFTIRLPADLRESGVTGAGSGAEAVPADGDGAEVLVIDDDAPTRDLLTRFLIREGFRVRTAVDGAEGLRLALATRPAAILLDVMMPRMDGWAVLSTLKADPKLADIPVIMVSFVQEKSLAFSLGAADYLPKPIDWQRLKRVVEPYRAGDMLGRALVVEHEADARDELRRMLELEGWSVAQAGSGEEALRSMAEAMPQVVLLDLQAPEPSGLAFLQEMRRHPEWRPIPVVAIADRELAPAERERLKGQVRRIVQAEDGVPEELVVELRRIAAGRVQPPALSSRAREEGEGDA
jgi:PAS domain S-box-containing protein